MVSNDIISTAGITAIAVPGIGYVVYYIFSIIKSRILSDKVQETGDKSLMQYIDLIKDERESLKKERDSLSNRLMQIETEKAKALADVQRLTVQIEFLSKQVVELKGTVAELSTQLSGYRTEIEDLKLQNSRQVAQIDYFSSMTKEVKPKTTRQRVKKQSEDDLNV